jgi:Ran-binding protein 1
MGEERSGSVTEDQDDVVEPNPDPHFEPIVNLLPVNTKTLEEDEEDMVKLRAKLFRYDTSAEPREWKERGTGDVKILRHKQTNICRLLMRRDKTLKICANHYILPHFELKPNCGSDRAWVWSTPADFADEEVKEELLAIRFASSDHAQEFKKAFDEAKTVMAKKLDQDKNKSGNKSTDQHDKKDEKEDEKAVSNSSSDKKESNSSSSGESAAAETAAAEVNKVADEVEKLTVKDKETPAEAKVAVTSSESSHSESSF